MRPRLARGVVALLVAVAAVSRPGPTFAGHGGPIEGVAIDFEGLHTVLDGAAGPVCVVGGSIHNASSQVVTVRVRYRAVIGADNVAMAIARIIRVAPGESRPFASSPFMGDHGAGVACAALRTVHMVEAVADPVGP